MARFRRGAEPDRPWDDQEKCVVMRDLLTHNPTFPKGLVYAGQCHERNLQLDRTVHAINSFIIGSLRKNYAMIIRYMAANNMYRFPLSAEEIETIQRIVNKNVRNSPVGARYSEEQMVERQVREDIKQELHCFRLHGFRPRALFQNLNQPVPPRDEEPFENVDDPLENENLNQDGEANRHPENENLDNPLNDQEDQEPLENVDNDPPENENLNQDGEANQHPENENLDNPLNDHEDEEPLENVDNDPPESENLNQDGEANQHPENENLDNPLNGHEDEEPLENVDNDPPENENLNQDGEANQHPENENLDNPLNGHEDQEPLEDVDNDPYGDPEDLIDVGQCSPNPGQNFKLFSQRNGSEEDNYSQSGSEYVSEEDGEVFQLQDIIVAHHKNKQLNDTNSNRGNNEYTIRTPPMTPNVKGIANLYAFKRKLELPQDGDGHYERAIKKPNQGPQLSNSKEYEGKQMDDQSDAMKNRVGTSNESESSWVPTILRVLGISSLYEWQHNCMREYFNHNSNMIVSLPTSGGKTLIAILMILHQIVEEQKDCLFVVPYVAVASEKVKELMQISVEIGFNVEEYSGSKGFLPPKKRSHAPTVYIATFEKGLNIIQSLMEEKRLSELGLAVFDELHMLGLGHRGCTLEASLVQLLLHSTCRIVGLSATLGNLDDVASFLKAQSFIGNTRPIPIDQNLVVDNKIFSLAYDRNGNCFISGQHKEINGNTPVDVIGQLVKETVCGGGSCLIFCPTQKSCQVICDAVKTYLDSRPVSHALQKAREDLIALIKDEGGTSDTNHFCKSVLQGVAYHHGGLSASVRHLTEEAFLGGTISAIFCTSTLSAGVNLPAQRVIIRDQHIGLHPMSSATYKQMIGRAGRAGLCNSKGDSFILANESNRHDVLKLLSSKAVCHSQLHTSDGTAAACSLILSNICTAGSIRANELPLLFKNSLMNVQQEALGICIGSIVSKWVQDLIDSKVLRVQLGDELFITDLGRAAMNGGFNPLHAAQLKQDIETCQATATLADPLPVLFYLCVPFNVEHVVPFNRSILDLHHLFLIAETKVNFTKTIKVNLSTFAKMVNGQPIKEQDQNKIWRLCMAFILDDLLRVKDLNSVTRKLKMRSSFLYDLLNKAATTAASVNRFCKVFPELWSLNCLLPIVSQNLRSCCYPELLPLMELPSVRICLARQLINAGYESLERIAEASPQDLADHVPHMNESTAGKTIFAAKSMIISKKHDILEALNIKID